MPAGQLIGDGVRLAVEIGFSTTAGYNLVPINTNLSTINWTDVSSYVVSVDTNRGRSSELDSFQAGSCSVVLDNRTRLFDPEFGPAAITFPGSSGNYLSATNAAFPATDNFDIKARIAPTLWSGSATNQSIFSKAGSSSTNQYQFILANTGVLRLQYTLDGSTAVSVDASTPLNFANGTPGWVRVTRQRSTGAVTFFYAPDSPYEPNSWTQISTSTSTPSA